MTQSPKSATETPAREPETHPAPNRLPLEAIRPFLDALAELAAQRILGRLRLESRRER